MSLEEDLKKETNYSKRQVGNFILNRLAIDKDAEKKWEKQHKCLDNCWNYILDKARAEADGESCYCAEDGIVYGWALEYMLDIKTEEKPLVKSQEEESQSGPNPVPKSEEKIPEVPVPEPEKPEKRKIYTKKPKKSDLNELGEQLTLF